MNAIARPWLSHYPDAVPTEIDVARLPTLKTLLETSFRQYAGRPAFTSFGKTLTYAEIERRRAPWAAGCRRRG